jgi:hypothetical protein
MLYSPWEKKNKVDVMYVPQECQQIEEKQQEKKR